MAKVIARTCFMDIAKTIISKLRLILQLIGLIIFIVLVWEILRNIGLLRNDLIPSVASITQSLIGLLFTEKFWADIAYTLFRAFVGLILACFLGIPIGFLIGSNKFLSSLGTPIVDFFRSIPVTSLYPVFVLLLGIGNEGKIGMIFVGCVLVILLHSITAFESRSLLRHHISRLYGASQSFILFRIISFEVLPNIITGIRVAIGFALIIAILTEMFMGANRGMGQSIMEAYSIYNMSTMFAYIFVLGLIGFFFNRIFARLESAMGGWRKR
ncbi:MAG: ABC transporter permease [Pyrinomonadaceae bacterium]